MSKMYKELLMDHYYHPRNKGDLKDADVVKRGSNPRCGDDIEVGIHLQGETLDKVNFRGRGCSVCIASASMMTESVEGKSRQQVEDLYQSMKSWFKSDDGEADDLLGSLKALSVVRDHPGRHRCVMLSWEALYSAIDEAN